MKVKILIGALVAFCAYGVIGTSGNVDEIRKQAPSAITARGWDILRYEGFQYGSYGKHGGYAWYHVQDRKNNNIQYRVKVSMWGGELEYHYGAPETLSRVELNLGE